MSPARRVLVAYPHGFCAGVRRAIDAVEEALQRFPPPIYCFNEIVHNGQVVEALAERGVIFVRSLDEVPKGAVLVFSAHGVTPVLRQDAERRGLTVIDATCPFVTKVHSEVRRYARDGFTIVLIGKRGHDEVVGVAGEAPDRVQVIEAIADAESMTVDDPGRVAVVTQTTLSLEETARITEVLRQRFPALRTPSRSDICYATTHRQEAVRRLAEQAERVLVLGASNSSNTQRLVEVARSRGADGHLVSELTDLAELDLSGVFTLGLTAGASTPEAFVSEVLAELVRYGFEIADGVRVAEAPVSFALPVPLR